MIHQAFLVIALALTVVCPLAAVWQEDAAISVRARIIFGTSEVASTTESYMTDGSNSAIPGCRAQRPGVPHLHRRRPHVRGRHES